MIGHLVVAAEPSALLASRGQWGHVRPPARAVAAAAVGLRAEAPLRGVVGGLGGEVDGALRGHEAEAEVCLGQRVGAAVGGAFSDAPISA